MSREIDLTKPLSDFDRAYLEARDRHADLRANYEAVGGKEPPQPSEPVTGPEATKNALDPGSLTPEQQAAYDAANPEGEDVVPYEDMTVQELKAELDARAKEADTDEEKARLAYTAKDNKQALIAKLEADDEAVAAE